MPKTGSAVLLIMDEFPDIVLNLKKNNPALLREFSPRSAPAPEPRPSQDRAPWLIGGSINISGTLDALGLVDLINDLDDVPLPVLTDPRLSSSCN